MRAVVLAILLGALAAPLAAQPSEPAMSDTARAHWQRGITAYRAHAYRVARDELEACYRIEPRRECLFAWAQAARLDGDCIAAVPLYREYLANDLTAKQADAARAQLAACEATLGPPAAPDTPPANPPSPAPSPVAAMPPSPASPAQPNVPSHTPWYRDRWTLGLFGTGSVALAGAALLYVSARSDANAHPATYDDYSARVDRAHDLRLLSLLAAGAGAALITTGVLRLILREASPAAEPHLSFEVSHTTIGAQYTRAF